MIYHHTVGHREAVNENHLSYYTVNMSFLPQSLSFFLNLLNYIALYSIHLYYSADYFITVHLLVIHHDDLVYLTKTITPKQLTLQSFPDSILRSPLNYQ